MSFPINALLNFRAPGVQQNLSRINRSFNRLKMTVGKAGAQLNAVGTGIRSAAIATAPVVGAVGLATKAFADFESQMSIVKSLTKGVTEKEFKNLNAEAKHLGATTVFTARQAGQGLEYLAKASFTAEEQIGSLRTVLDLAAAGSLELGDASDILTDSLSALSPAMDKQAGRVKNLAVLGDMFALVQSETNTNVQQLGEAVKYGGQSLASFGVQLPDIIASIGALANAGLKGSMGGTSLMNMFNKLVKPTGQAGKFIKKYGISLTDATGKMRRAPIVIDEFVQALANTPDEAERSAVAIELFGIRGLRAFNSMKNEGIKSITGLSDRLVDSVGESSRQAAVRVDNLKGAFTRFFSGASGAAIEVGGIFGKYIRNPIEKAAKLLSGVATAFQLVTGQIEESSKYGKEFFKNFGPDRSQQILDFVSGFLEGMDEIKNTLKIVMDYAKDFVSGFTDAGTSMKDVGKLVAKIVAGMIIAMPILVSIAAGFFVLGPIITGVWSLIGLIGSAFTIMYSIAQIVFSAIAAIVTATSLPFLAIIAVIAAVGIALYIFWDDVVEIFTGIGRFVTMTWRIIKSFAIVIFSELIGWLRNIFPGTFDFIVKHASTAIEVFGSFVMDTIPNAFSWAIDKVIGLFTMFKNFIVGVGSFIFDALTYPIRGVIGLIKGVISKVADSTIGRTALSMAGVDMTAMKGMLSNIPDIESKGAKPNIKSSIAKIGSVADVQRKSIERKSIVGPAPSLGTNISESGSQSRGETTTNVNVMLDGRVLAIAQAKHQLENEERMGVRRKPIDKRRMIENGNIGI